MIRCIIVDDDEMSREHLSRLCKRIEEVTLLATFEEGLSAFKFLENNEVDLVFLDIEMPELTGIELIQELSHRPATIFITSNPSYAFKTFEFIESVIDYVVKPISLARLLKAIKRFNQQLPKQEEVKQAKPSLDKIEKQPVASKERHIFVKTERKYVRIDLDELLYIETIGDYALFKTQNQQYTVHATLKKIQEKLQDPTFFKVHRSYIVNLGKIKDIEDNNLLIGNKIIPISRTRRNELMERIMPL